MNEHSGNSSGPAIACATVHSIKPSANKTSYWTSHRLARIKRALTRRAAVLRSDIARQLSEHGVECTELVAANVLDDTGQSLAGSLRGPYRAAIDRDVVQLLGIERALARLASQTYGTCVGCGDAVDPMRLEFNPQAAFCLHCEENTERPLQRAKRFTTL